MQRPYAGTGRFVAVVLALLFLFAFHYVSASEALSETDNQLSEEETESVVLEEVIVIGTRIQLDPPEASNRIWDSDAENHITEFAEVCGIIFDSRIVRSDPIVYGDDFGALSIQATHLYFGQAYPDYEFSAIIMDAYRGDFPYPLASLKGHKACVFGKVGRYRGKPAMMLFRPEQIATEKTEFINTSR